MMRLIVRDLFAKWRIWLGTFFVAAMAAAAGSVAASVLETGASLPRFQALGLFAVGTSVVLFAVVAGVVVLSSTIDLTVTLQRRQYALWQLVGVRPFLVTLVVRIQLALVAVFGGAAGCLAAGPFAPAFLRFGLADSSGLEDVRGRFSFGAAVWVVASVALVVIVSGLRSSRRAGRVMPVEALRQPKTLQARMTVRRWITAGALVALAAGLIGGLTSADPGGGTQLLIIGPLIAAATIAFAPILFPRTLSWWTRIIPAGVSTSWYLARRAALFELSRSSSAISSLIVTIALPASIYTGLDTFSRAVTGVQPSAGSGLSVRTLLLLLGGPLLLSASGAASTVFMSGRARDREAALLRASGGTSLVVVMSALCQSVIYVGTASLLAFGVCLITGIAEAIALGIAFHRSGLSLGWIPLLTVAGGCMLLLAIATLIPAVTSSRQGVVQQLAEE